MGTITEIFNYETYQKGEFKPVIDPNGNNGNWWIYLLAGIGILGILTGVRKIKNFPQIN